MKNVILAVLFLGSFSAIADEVEFNAASDGSATLMIRGTEAEKPFSGFLLN